MEYKKMNFHKWEKEEIKKTIENYVKNHICCEKFKKGLFEFHYFKWGFIVKRENAYIGFVAHTKNKLSGKWEEDEISLQYCPHCGKYIETLPIILPQTVTFLYEDDYKNERNFCFIKDLNI